MSKINQLDDDENKVLTPIEQDIEYFKNTIFKVPKGLDIDLSKVELYTGPTQASHLPRSMACDHNFKAYIGFTDAFEYCTVCDTKKRV